MDDAYITLHNARSLLTGGDQAYGVSPLVGATSLVHLAVLTLLGTMLPLPVASIMICGVAAIIYAVALNAAVRKVGATGWFQIAAVMSGMLAGTVAYQLMNGLETGMAMAAVAAMLALSDDRRWLPILAGAAPFIRPELALLGGPLILRMCWGAPLNVAIKVVLISIAAAFPWVVWSLIETGAPIPGTIAAKIAFFTKSDGFLDALAQGPRPALAVIAPVLALMIAIAAFCRVTSGPLRWSIAIFVGGVIGAVELTLPGGLGWNDFRYLAPLAPALIVAIVEFDDQKLAKALIAVIGVSSIAAAGPTLDHLQGKRAYSRGELEGLRSTIAQLPAGSRVLVHDAGMIAWVAPQLRLIDAVGLKTPQSVDWHRRYTKDACQFGRALDGIARAQDVQFVLVLQRPFWRCIGDNLAQEGWSLQPLPSAGVYQLYRLAPPGARPKGLPVAGRLEKLVVDEVAA